jgi:hypothetical protein
MTADALPALLDAIAAHGVRKSIGLLTAYASRRMSPALVGAKPQASK